MTWRKQARRVRTGHAQMSREGQWRGGFARFVYKADILGRTHRINRPAKDWRIDGKKEGAKRRIVEGCDTNRAARRLNDRGIKTTAKRRWGGTRLSRLIDSPVYICILKFGDERSGPLDNSHPLYVIFPWRLRWHRYLRDRRITI